MDLPMVVKGTQYLPNATEQQSATMNMENSRRKEMLMLYRAFPTSNSKCAKFVILSVFARN
jgi:hypothetical protein